MNEDGDRGTGARIAQAIDGLETDPIVGIGGRVDQILDRLLVLGGRGESLDRFEADGGIVVP